MKNKYQLTRSVSVNQVMTPSVEHQQQDQHYSLINTLFRVTIWAKIYNNYYFSVLKPLMNTIRFILFFGALRKHKCTAVCTLRHCRNCLANTVSLPLIASRLYMTWGRFSPVPNWDALWRQGGWSISHCDHAAANFWTIQTILKQKNVLSLTSSTSNFWAPTSD